MSGVSARDDLREAAQRRKAAQAALDDALEALRVAVLASLSEGLPEAQAAREAGVSRTTVRAWRAEADG